MSVLKTIKCEKEDIVVWLKDGQCEKHNSCQKECKYKKKEEKTVVYF